MKIHRCQCQEGSEIELDYLYMESDHPMPGAMLALLRELRVLDFHREIYALTSMHKLCLLSEDDYETPWWVTVEYGLEGGYEMEVIVSEREAFSSVHNLEPGKMALQVLRAMHLSGGWRGR